MPAVATAEDGNVQKSCREEGCYQSVTNVGSTVLEGRLRTGITFCEVGLAGGVGVKAKRNDA